MNYSKQPPLYNTNFSLYRASPFHTGNSISLDNELLSNHARKFQNILEGEGLRGVRIGTTNENNLIMNIGALQSVTWSIFHEDFIYFQNNKDNLTTEDENRVMSFTVSYDRVVYRAIFLQHTCKDGLTIEREQVGFHHFPLLLLKMPMSLRRLFLEYVSTAFDARMSSLHLSQLHLTNCFEKFISELYTYESGDTREDIEMRDVMSNIIRDAFMKIGFDLPNGSHSLKAIDIKILSEDIIHMIASRGKTTKSPFFEATGAYLNTHLALDLWNPKVKIVRIACAALILDTEGKFKLTQPPSIDIDNLQIRASRKLIENLIGAAIGSALKH